MNKLMKYKDNLVLALGCYLGKHIGYRFEVENRFDGLYEHRIMKNKRCWCGKVVVPLNLCSKNRVDYVSPLERDSRYPYLGVENPESQSCNCVQDIHGFSRPEDRKSGERY